MSEEIKEILAAYDLTGSYRKAAELAGCDHHTVRRYVQLRGTGIDPAVRLPRTKLIDLYMPTVEELIEASHGRIGARAVAGDGAQAGIHEHPPTRALE
ncbi:hypothetical protein ACTWPB_08130 [Nocardia sp. IBHARD005]|uniref:hypothetical protein n=1 Tax=Nocardia sp. IBHARD005 TaxID=3457765 RepID=UPI00405A2D53